MIEKNLSAVQKLMLRRKCDRCSAASLVREARNAKRSCIACPSDITVGVRIGARRAAVVRAGGEPGGIFGFAAAPARCIFSPIATREITLLSAA